MFKQRFTSLKNFPGFISILSLLLFSSTVARCPQHYRELGPESTFVRFNGEPVIPNWVHYNSLRYGQPVYLSIHKTNKFHLFFYIASYHGPGRYAWHPGDTTFEAEYYKDSHWVQDSSGTGHSVKTGYHPFPQGNTYVRIVEADTLSMFLHAVYEVHLADSTGQVDHFTEGRIFLYVPDNY